MLSQWLKCPVKLELQVVQNPKDVIYKYIWNTFNVVDATRYHMTEIYLFVKCNRYGYHLLLIRNVMSNVLQRECHELWGAKYQSDWRALCWQYYWRPRNFQVVRRLKNSLGNNPHLQCHTFHVKSANDHNVLFISYIPGDACQTRCWQKVLTYDINGENEDQIRIISAINWKSGPQLRKVMQALCAHDVIPFVSG